MGGSEPRGDGETDAHPTNVFVNCPFDDEYFPLLRPLRFTIVFAGYHPRIATERSDSGENRLDKICGLIRESRTASTICRGSGRSAPASSIG